MGIVAGITALIESIAPAIGGEVAATAAGALAGAGEGAITAAVTGGDPGKGALGGALSGGVTSGLAPVLSSVAPGLGAAASDTIAGAAGGALGAAATGTNIGTGLLEGAGTGLARGVIGGAGASGGGPAGASTTAAPTSGNFLTPETLSGPDVPAGTSAPTMGTTGADIASGAGAALPGSISAAPTASTLPGGVGAGAAAPGSTGGVSLSPSSAGGATQVPTLTSTPNLATPAPVAAPAAPAPVAAAPSGGGFKDFLSKPQNLLPIAAFGMDILKGNQMPPQFNQLSADAARMKAQGGTLQGYINSGTLPPGMQLAVNAAGDAAKASVRSTYANRGMTGSSAEYADLAGVGEREAAKASELAVQLFQQGLAETNAADTLYMDLMNVQMQQDQGMSTAIGTLAASMARMGQPVAPQLPAGG